MKREQLRAVALVWLMILSVRALGAEPSRKASTNPVSAGASARAAEGSEADDIDVTKVAGQLRLVPVALEGFNGEVANVLRFDLEVQGFKIVPTAEAQYVLSGSGSSSLVGRVTDAVSRASLLSKEYTGGSARLQAHTFADDFVGLFPGRSGIARRRIVFRIESGKTSEIYVADYDGFGAVQATRDSSLARDPAWVPGRRALLYTSYKSGTPCIYSHDLANGVRTQIAGFAGLNASPAVSPDGRRVAMILSKSGSPDLFVANIDGSALTRLTTTREDESSPCWSPDGRTICVVSRMSGRAALYAVPAAGGPMRRIETSGAINATEPSWSPDGQTIAFTANMGGFQICTVPARGGSAEVLVGGEDPSWAPNSRTILFTKRSGSRRILSLLDVPTKRVKDVTQISGSTSQPDWSR